MVLRLTDFKLLVQGMQSVTKRVGLNNSGLLLLVEVRLVEREVTGSWGSHGSGGLGQVGGGATVNRLFSIYTGHARHYQEEHAA